MTAAVATATTSRSQDETRALPGPRNHASRYADYRFPKALLATPYTGYLTLAFLVFVLVTMGFTVMHSVLPHRQRTAALRDDD